MAGGWPAARVPVVRGGTRDAALGVIWGPADLSRRGSRVVWRLAWGTAPDGWGTGPGSDSRWLGDWPGHGSRSELGLVAQGRRLRGGPGRSGGRAGSALRQEIESLILAGTGCGTQSPVV